MGELDRPRAGETLDASTGLVLRWDLLRLTAEAACMVCGRVVEQATAEAVMAGEVQLLAVPHECRPGQYVDPCLAKNLNQSGENNE